MERVWGCDSRGENSVDADCISLICAKARRRGRACGHPGGPRPGLHAGGDALTGVLRRRFVLIAMCALSATLVCLIAGINLSYNWRIDRRAEGVMDCALRNDGQMPAVRHGRALPAAGNPRLRREWPASNRTGMRRHARGRSRAIAAFDRSAAELHRRDRRTGKGGLLRTFATPCMKTTTAAAPVLVLDCSQQLQGGFRAPYAAHHLRGGGRVLGDRAAAPAALLAHGRAAARREPCAAEAVYHRRQPCRLKTRLRSFRRTRRWSRAQRRNREWVGSIGARPRA